MSARKASAASSKAKAKASSSSSSSSSKVSSSKASSSKASSSKASSSKSSSSAAAAPAFELADTKLRGKHGRGQQELELRQLSARVEAAQREKEERADAAQQRVERRAQRRLTSASSSSSSSSSASSSSAAAVAASGRKRKQRDDNDDDDDDEHSADDAELDSESDAESDVDADSDSDDDSDSLDDDTLYLSRRQSALSQRGVIYVGHIPHGFYETEMSKFFSQFGKVTRLRLSRSKRTGRSKGYAFIEFAEADIAAIAAEAMHNYMMLGRVLKCMVVPREKLHPALFKGAGQRFRVIDRTKINRRRHNREKSHHQYSTLVARLLDKEKAQRAQLAREGIKYDFPGYAAEVARARPKRIKFSD